MKIYDIPQAIQITINMVYKNANYKAEATVLTRYGDGVLVTAVKCANEIVDVCTNAVFEFTEHYTGIKHMFKVDTLARVDFAGSDFTVINGKEIIPENNARRAERYTLQLTGSAVINRSNPISVIIQDISMRGFSILIGKSSSVKKGDRVKVDFFRSASDRKLTLMGTVVREFNIGEYRAVGCEMKGVSPRVLGFIMDKKAEHESEKHF